MRKPRVAISQCLLGERIRFNGEHKYHQWLVENLGPLVEWVPVCPEMAMGLGTPRPAMRLLKDSKLVVIKTGEDLTEKASNTAEQILSKLRSAPGLPPLIDAFIFKKDSPSCGLERVKVYNVAQGNSAANAFPRREGVGVFAQAFKEALPEVLTIEEGRLSDLNQRYLFLIHLFALVEFSELPLKISALQKFHQVYKLLLLAYSPKNYQELGKLAAQNQKNNRALADTFFRYKALLSETLALQPTVKLWTNVLEHMLGYFKKNIEPLERKLVHQKIRDFHQNRVPLLVPLTLIEHLSKKHETKYLLTQKLFERVMELPL